MANSSELKKENINNTFFDENGYIIVDTLRKERLTYPETKSLISKKLTETRQLIETKKRELSELKGYQSSTEHSDRTIWLLFKEKKFL